MAAAWQSGARGFSAANVSTLATDAFTISGSNRYLEVLVFTGAGTPQNLTSVVWDAAGVNESLTQVESYITFNTNFRVSKWALTAPSTGTSKVVTATWAGVQDETLVIADSYTGIDQTTPARTRPTPGQGTSSTPTLSVTSVADDLVVGAAVAGISAADLTTISSSAVTVREKIEGADIGNHEQAVQGDVLATGTSTSVGFQLDTSSTTPTYVIFGAALIPAVSAPTATIVTGSATMGVGIAETYTYKLDFSPSGTVNVTPTAPVAGSWSSSPLALTSGNWNTGLTSNFTASASGSGNVSSTNDGGLTDDTLAVTVHPVSRPSAVTPGTWTDEAGGSLVVADINDASDATGAMDASGPDYTALPFTLATPMAAGSQTVYYRGKEILAGKQVRIELFANDGTTLVWSGAWQTMTGTITTYSEVATLSATAYKGEIQKQADPPPVNGIIMPNKTETPHDVMLLWVTSAMVPRSSHTIIWKAKISSGQTGFHANWWHLPNAASSWPAETYCYGTHPYPALAGTVDGNGQNTSGSSSTGTDHWYEIAGLGANDYLATAGSSTVYPVTKDTWVTQARTCEVDGSNLKHRFWPDISNPSDYIEQLITTASLTTPTSERVVFGNSPWDTTECGAGTFRGIKMFDVALSISDIGSEATSNIDNAVTTAGIASIWYSNENPTPTDVSDKQTQRTTHSPSWANASRPTLYTE